MIYKQFDSILAVTSSSGINNRLVVVGLIILVIVLIWILYKIFTSKKGQSKHVTKKVMTAPDKEVVLPEEPKPNNEGITPITLREQDEELDEYIIMPASGKLMTIDKVPDPMYSEKVLGDGFAIEPTSGKIFSPVSGRVESVSGSRNGLVLVTPSNHKVIVHFGLGTAKLGGKGFALHVAEGEKIKAGDTLCTMDLDLVAGRADSLITPIVFANLEKDERVVVKQEGIVAAKMPKVVVIEKGTKPEQ